MKQPKPWFWETRGAWYLTRNGKPIKLAEKEQDAWAEYHRNMAAEGRLDQRQAAKITVADACKTLIGSVSYFRPDTVRNYRDLPGPFAAAGSDSTRSAQLGGGGSGSTGSQGKAAACSDRARTPAGPTPAPR